MTSMTFEEFETQSLNSGFNEVIERVWEPDLTLEAHTHPYDVHVFLAEGELWLTKHGVTQHVTAGQDFTLAAEEVHAERYGSEGATFWVARKHKL